MLDLLKELWLYLKIRRNFIIVFVIIFLLILGVLVFLAESPVLAPFIYPIF